MKNNLFVLAAVFISTQLSAQQDTSLLNEAVVTANRYQNKTSLTGKVVTIITREELEQSGGKDLSQVLTEQAGLYIAGANSNSGKEKSLYLRGARVDHTLITVDGVPLYDPSGIGANFDIRNINLQNIERIEILKGSQSTLYGSDAIAGVINIITRKKTGKPISADALAGYGSFGTFRVAAGIDGHSGKLEYQASYSMQDTRGINEAENKTPGITTDKDGLNQQSFQAGAGISPSEKIRIMPFFRYSRIRGDIDQGAFTDELDYTYSQKSWQTGLRNEFAFDKIKLTVLYSYNNIDRIYTDDSIKSRNGFDTWSQGKYRGHEHFADAFLSSPLSNTLKISAGIDYRASSSDQQYRTVGFFGPFSTEYNHDSLHQRQLGIYAALNWTHQSGFNAEAGGRVNFHSEYGSYAVYNFNPSYLFRKKWKFFANLSSGYRTPSLYQLFSEYGNRSLKPEAAISWEGGIQYYDKKNRFTGRFVYFSRKVKDLVFFYFNPVSFSSQYINQDLQKDHGFEAEAHYSLTKQIRLKAFYAFVTGHIRTLNGTKDTTYNNLLRRPKSSGGISLSADIRKRFFLSSNLMIVGERQDAYFDNSSFSTVNSTLGAYALWDIYGEYSLISKRLKLFAAIRNITNCRYREISGFNTPGTNGSIGFRLNLQ